MKKRPKLACDSRLTGTFVFFLAGVMALGGAAGSLLDTAFPIALMLVQGVMAGGATGLAYRAAQEAGAAKPLWSATAPVAILVVAFGVLAIYAFLQLPREPGIVLDRVAVVGSLRTTNTAAITYASTYKNGYPPSLAVLGPPKDFGKENCNTAGLMDELLASGQRSHYVFKYTPGAPLEKPPSAGCPRGVKSYTVTARPIKYKDTDETPNFFTDETGVIRITREDRPATAQDEPIGR